MRTTLITIVSGVLFLSSTQASPHSLKPRRTTGVPTGYSYEGCWTEATDMRALSGSFYLDDLMTVQKCAVACAKFPYFGVEFGRECFCGSTLNEGSRTVFEEDCNYPCPGNLEQFCGAGNRLNVYLKSSISTSTTPSTATPTPGIYADKGCYTEPTNGRALSSHVFYDDAMTTEKCASECAGFIYFGIEYHRECYCSNTIAEGSVPAPIAECNFQCDADATQLCGGDWRLNMYTFGTTTSTSSSPISTPTPGPTNYVSEGCRTDSPASRTLIGAIFFDDAMTVEMCSVICTGYSLFGTEYSRECYCGNALQGESSIAPASDCNMKCAGDSAETCGAGDRLSLFRYGSTALSSSSSVVPTSTTTATTTTSVLTTSTTLSTTTTTTTTTTTSPTPVPTINIVPNGSFENTDTVGWIPSSSYVCPLCPTHNFRAKTDPNTGVVPHGGSQMAAVSMKLDAGNYFGNFETRVTTLPNTSYRLSAWSWIPLDGAFCQVRYYFQPLTPETENPYQSVNVADSDIDGNTGVWKEATFTFTSGTGGIRALIVQVSCNGASNAARMIYVDDVSLTVV